MAWPVRRTSMPTFMAENISLGFSGVELVVKFSNASGPAPGRLRAQSHKVRAAIDAMVTTTFAVSPMVRERVTVDNHQIGQLAGFDRSRDRPRHPDTLAASRLAIFRIWNGCRPVAASSCSSSLQSESVWRQRRGAAGDDPGAQD